MVDFQRLILTDNLLADPLLDALDEGENTQVFMTFFVDGEMLIDDVFECHKHQKALQVYSGGPGIPRNIQMVVEYTYHSIMRL